MSQMSFFYTQPIKLVIWQKNDTSSHPFLLNSVTYTFFIK